MDPFTADYLANLTAELSALLLPKAARRLQKAWQGDETAVALQRCLHSGVLGLVSRASLDAPEDEALLADIFEDFFRQEAVATQLLPLLRARPLDIDELAFLFHEAGNDAATLPGLHFEAAIAAFEAAFLEAAALEPALQPIIGVHQSWAQTALQREMVALMRQMVAALKTHANQKVGIQAGRIVAENVVSGTQRIDQQIIYQWGEAASATQTWQNSYLKALISRCNQLDLADVDERVLADKDEVHLTDVFTTLYAARNQQVIRRAADQSISEAVLRPSAEMLDDGRHAKRASRPAPEAEETEPVTAVSAVGSLPRLVILGHPGGGKSSLVNYLATWLARQHLNAAPALPDWPTAPLLPVRIVLRRFAAWVVSETGNEQPVAHAGLVWRYLEEKLLPEWGCAEAYGHIKQTLQSEGGVIFFDGLDEVPESIDDARRSLIKQTIIAFAQPLDTCKIVVTCREYAYKKDDAWRLPQVHFPVIELALFGESEIRQFTRTWYQVMGPRLDWSGEKQQQEAERLADAVIAQPHLRELGQYPLLLTLMAQVHGRYGDLPENRADLYDRAVNLLLSHWENRLVRRPDGSQQIEPGLIARLNLRREDVRSILQAIAFAAHERQEGQQDRDRQAADISRDELWEGLLPLVGGSYDGAKTITDYIQQRSGLLQAKEGTTYAFPHRTFQEYLAAAHVWSLPQDPVEALYRRLQRDTPWWREIFLLAAGQARADAYRVKSLVDRLVPVPPAAAAVSDWQLTQALLAAQTLHETNFIRFVRSQDAHHPYVLLVQRVHDWLQVALVDEVNLAPPSRALAGQALGRWIEDRRPGVGVDAATGLPHIIWSAEIPAGTYTIGDDKSEYDDEKPRQVTIERPYRIARYPITNAQFDAFIAEAEEAAWWKNLPAEESAFAPPAFSYSNHPRETVSWYQAVAFCRWLTAKLHQGVLQIEALEGAATQYEIALPHEYEWEVAARWPNEDVQQRIYPWGSAFDAAKANTSEGERVGQTTAVGIYPAGKNAALELYDLSGNVWEWCRNRYNEPDQDMDSENLNLGSDARVLRGGSWDRKRSLARAVARLNDSPDYRFNVYLGFRVVAVRRPPS